MFGEGVRNSYPLLFFPFQLLQCAAELVGTTGGFRAATDAVEQTDDFVGGLAHDEARDALRVAVTSSVEVAVADASFGVGLHVDELAASAGCLIKHGLRF